MQPPKINSFRWQNFAPLLITLFAATTPLFALNLTFPIFAPQALAQTPIRGKTEADRLFQQGINQVKAKQFQAAIQPIEQALNIYSQIGDREGEADSLSILGAIYAATEQYQQSIKFSVQAFKIYREIGDRKGENNSLFNLGVAFNNLGTAYAEQKQYQQAIEFFEQAITIRREIGDREGEARTLGSLGLIYDELGNYTKAIEAYQQVLVVAKEIDAPGLQATAWGNLGFAYRALNEFTKVIDSFEQALVIFQEIGDLQKAGQALGNIGSAYNNLGDYAKAIIYLEQRLALARKIGDRQGEIAGTRNISNAYYFLGNYSKAIEYQQESLKLAEAISDRGNQAGALNNIGNIYYQLGEFHKAIYYYEQYLVISEELGDRADQGKALGNLGLAYSAVGDYAKAIEFIKKDVEIAQELGARFTEGQAWGSLGSAYQSQENYEKALVAYEQSLNLARQVNYSRGEGITLTNIGNTLREMGKLSEAEKAFQSSIRVFESIRKSLGNNDTYKVSIFDAQIRPYRMLQQVFVAQNKPLEALEISELSRARAFVELLASRLSSQQIEKLIVKPPNLEQIQQIAKRQNATIVEYSFIDFRDEKAELYIWIVQPTGEIAFRQVDLTQSLNSPLQEFIASSRESIGVRGNGSFEFEDVNEKSQVQNLQKLHKILIEPIAELLPKNPDERVIFVPHRSLFLVPFPALQDEEGKYLIEKHTILTAPAIQVLDLTRQQSKKVYSNSAKDILVVGNPTMPHVTTPNGEPPTQLSQLSGAEKEAVEIAQLLNTKAIIKEQATETAIVKQLSQARIIHLATHGLLEDFGGLGVPGAIALAPSNQDDGFLTASEILELELNAELVVLSACDTGRGNITGDGVIGLSRSLISAGTPSVVVSLWSVPDAPTAFLMTEFYRHLEAGKDKAQALRQAMLTTMKQKKHPRDWAAFTLIGEAE